MEHGVKGQSSLNDSPSDQESLSTLQLPLNDTRIVRISIPFKLVSHTSMKIILVCEIQILAVTYELPVQP
jgi:hypothetical protein